jgi:hypothetical protein
MFCLVVVAQLNGPLCLCCSAGFGICLLSRAVGRVVDGCSRLMRRLFEICSHESDLGRLFRPCHRVSLLSLWSLGAMFSRRIV